MGEDDELEGATTLERDEQPLPGLAELLGANERGELLELGPGTVIDGRWDLRERLGGGGFGEVYEAWNRKLDNPVAIKILRSDRTDAKQRFLEEAQLMAGMSSEHLVRVLDYGELPDGSPYFVMDLVKGKSLRHWLHEGRLPLWRAVEIGEQVLAGLVEAHQCGVVHGDIKPENVVIGDDGKVKLIDFGLARTAATDGEELRGTPHYMAPEMLFDDAPASERADVYAVGVVLYELLTGRLPRGYLDAEGFSKARAAWESKPKPSPVRMYYKDVPQAQSKALEALDKLVMEALARDPTKRPRSAVPMLEELRRLRRRLSPEAVAPTLTAESGGEVSTTEVRTTQSLETVGAPGRWWRWWPWVVGLVVVIVVPGLLAWWGGWREAAVPETPLAIAGGDEPPVEATGRDEVFDVEKVRAASGGILVAVREDASDAVMEGYDALCKALGGDRPAVEGALPLLCRPVPAVVADGDLMGLAEQAAARVVVLVGYGAAGEIEVRSTTHHRGNALMARLDGLPLPRDPEALAMVAPVFRAVVGATDAAEIELGAPDWMVVGARWGVLVELVRAEQGYFAHEDLMRREELARALERMAAESRERGEDDGTAFYRDLAALVSASSQHCTAAEPTLRALSKAGDDVAVLRVSAQLGLARCLMEGPEAASKVDEAAALLTEALAASDDPCNRVAAIGSISRIDRWRGGDALWQEHAKRLPPRESCGPAMWSRGLAVRGDALVAAGRPCDAAKAYAQAYGAERTMLDPLLNWAEYAWACKPGLETPRQELLDELDAALASEAFGRPEQRVSIAYLRWWIGRNPSDPDRVLEAYAKVGPGAEALIPGVASSLEPEICKGAKGAACSRRILARRKEKGDDARLRRSLGLR